MSRTAMELASLVWGALEESNDPEWVAKVYRLTDDELWDLLESFSPRFRAAPYDLEPWLYERHQDHRTVKSRRLVLIQERTGFTVGLQPHNPYKLVVGLHWCSRSGR